MMNFQAVKAILDAAGFFTLSTLKDGAPEARPFGAVTPFDGGLYLNTGSAKAVCGQLRADGRVCLCAFAAGAWVRIRATAAEDDRREAREAVLEAQPALRGMYAADDGSFAVFRLKEATAEIHRGSAVETLTLP
ncbi:MAG: pyridoxamine 5'-phosphate oxidase family protein [Eubacteriales bacterium]|nr:pyridoxamine 5'-phosphate oxidase family protein [Eubacteriales bacterium]